jgi:hypothetical protein
MPLRDTLANLKQVRPEATDPASVRQNWQNAVAALYAKIERNLVDYMRNGLIELQRVPVTRSEDKLGSYEIDELHLKAGPETIIVSPVATGVIGARGRVDVYRRGYADNRYMILWIGRTTTAPGWRVAHSSHRTALRPYTKAWLEETLDTLLTQA